MSLLEVAAKAFKFHKEVEKLLTSKGIETLPILDFMFSDEIVVNVKNGVVYCVNMPAIAFKGDILYQDSDLVILDCYKSTSLGVSESSKQMVILSEQFVDKKPTYAKDLVLHFIKKREAIFERLKRYSSKDFYADYMQGDLFDRLVNENDIDSIIELFFNESKGNDLYLIQGLLLITYVSYIYSLQNAD